MEYRQIQPQHPSLTRYIHSYTSSIGSIEEAESKYITRAFPSFLTHIYFEFHGGLSERDSGTGRSAINRGCLINCGIGSWMDIYQLESSVAKREIKNFKVDLYPHAIFEIFHVSPKELVGTEYSIEDLCGASETSRLYEKLEAAPNGMGMVEIFESYLLHRLLKGPGKIETMAPHLLRRYNNLRALSHKTGYSERWLQKKYREIFGLSFKQLQTNQRFLQTLSALNRSLDKPQVSLSELALAQGYFDQAHFIKEFRRFTGLTPSQYRNAAHLNRSNFFW